MYFIIIPIFLTIIIVTIFELYFRKLSLNLIKFYAYGKFQLDTNYYLKLLFINGTTGLFIHEQNTNKYFSVNLITNSKIFTIFHAEYLVFKYNNITRKLAVKARKG